MQYCSEIHDYKAIAVVAVLIFYAGISGFDGGYVGIDIFLVISGLLPIQQTLTREIHGVGRF